MNPFVINAKRHRGNPPVITGETEYAVESIDRAVPYLEGLVSALVPWPSDPKTSHAAALWLRSINPAGDSFTLPDGIVIEVRPYRWRDLAACANVRWEDTPECRAMVLDRFNAQEAVA